MVSIAVSQMLLFLRCRTRYRQCWKIHLVCGIIFGRRKKCRIKKEQKSTTSGTMSHHNWQINMCQLLSCFGTSRATNERHSEYAGKKRRTQGRDRRLLGIPRVNLWMETKCTVNAPDYCKKYVMFLENYCGSRRPEQRSLVRQSNTKCKRFN